MKKEQLAKKAKIKIPLAGEKGAADKGAKEERLAERWTQRGGSPEGVELGWRHQVGSVLCCCTNMKKGLKDWKGGLKWYQFVLIMVREKLFLKKPTGQLMTLILQTPIFFEIELKFVCSFSNSFTLQTSEPDRRSCWRWIALASRIFHKFCRKFVVQVKIQRSYKRFVKKSVC